MSTLLLAGLLTARAAVPPLADQAILQIEAQRLPPTALATFVEDADPAVRARAARGLGRLRSAAALAGLRRLAEDPAVEVRLEAAFALGQTPGAADLALARLQVEPDAQVRARLVEALGKQGDTQAVPALLASLHRQGGLRPAPEAAMAAVALGRLAMRDIEAARDPTVLAALVRTLERLDKPTRRAAAFALARSGAAAVPEPERAALLDRATGDWDPVVRALLVRAAAGLALEPAERDTLLARAARDTAPGVRVAAARAAGRTGWEGVVDLLDDADRGVRREAITAVGAVESLAPAEHLQRFVDRGASLEAAEALAARGDPAVIEAAAAIRALAARGRLGGVERYLALGMPERIRAAAVEAVEDPARLAALATQDGEGMVRTAAATRLVALAPGDAQVLPLLEGFDPIVAAIAAEHLATHPVPRSEGPLLQALLEADQPDLLRATAQALAARYKGHPNPPLRKQEGLDDALQALAVHPDAGVRGAAIELRAALKLPPAGPGHTIVSAPLPEVQHVLGARVQTSRGSFVIDLLPEEAPLTVWNFAWLADQGYYDNLRLHRVVPDFVVQDGDPRGDGYGGPGWTIPDEINPISYDEGVVGMALSGPDTGGSQWFVTLSPQPHLDGGYTAFGRVRAGMHVVRSLQPGDRIETVRIERRQVAPTTSAASNDTAAQSASPAPTPSEPNTASP